MADMDLSWVPPDDLDAIAKGDWSKVSQPVLDRFNGKAQPSGPVKMAPPSGLAGPLGSAVTSAAAPFDALASGVSHAASAVAEPVASLAARLVAAVRGKNDEDAANAVRGFFAGPGTYHAVTPGGQTAENDAAVLGAPAKALAPIVNSIPGATNPTVQHVAGVANDVLGSLPVAGAIGDAARVAARAPASLVARGGADVATEAGYTGLKSRADLKAPGSQAITDKLIGQDAGLIPGSDINVEAVQNARKVGPGKVYDAVQKAMPEQLTADDGLKAGIKGIGDTTSQLPKSPDVDALRETMLSQPNMTRDELFANIRTARQKAGSLLASENPDQVALGHAYNELAGAYEDFAGRHIPPESGVSMDQWLNARTQFAKSYLAENALKGGEHFDPAVYGRAGQNDPNLLSGGAQVVARTFNSLPAAAENNALARGIGSAVGAAGGAALEHAATGAVHGIGPGVAAVVGGQVAPAVRDALTSFFTRGKPAAAAAAPTNPRLSYFYQRGGAPAPAAAPAGPPLSLAGELGAGGPHTPPGPGGDIPLADLLSHGVEQPPAPGLTAGPMGAPAPQGVPFRASPETARLAATSPQGPVFTHGPDLALASHPAPAAAPPSLGDLATVMSQGVPEGIATRTAPKGGAPLSAGRPGFLTNNASGESAASQEAINRGTRNLVHVDADGNEEPILRDVTQADVNARKGGIIADAQTGDIVKRSPELSQRAAAALRNRWASMMRLGDTFASAR